MGFVDGQNLIVETRAAEGLSERLTPLAQELVAWKPDAIVADSTSCWGRGGAGNLNTAMSRELTGARAAGHQLQQGARRLPASTHRSASTQTPPAEVDGSSRDCWTYLPFRPAVTCLPSICCAERPISAALAKPLPASRVNSGEHDWLASSRACVRDVMDLRGSRTEAQYARGAAPALQDGDHTALLASSSGLGFQKPGILEYDAGTKKNSHC
jgi:hypothetical protein